MPIVNIKYDISDRDDRMSFQRAMYSLDMASFIFEVICNGRKKCEAIYGEEPTIEQVWEYIHKQLENHNINIDNIIE
jgi:hypothetical protein